MRGVRRSTPSWPRSREEVADLRRGIGELERRTAEAAAKTKADGIDRAARNLKKVLGGRAGADKQLAQSLRGDGAPALRTEVRGDQPSPPCQS